eukprot:gene19568-20010_t
METTALKVVVQHAVIAEKIQANIEKYEGNYENEINWNSTRIDIRSFTNWLNAKNFGSCFFTDNWLDIPGYADAEGPFYAPKLAAAVDGWRAVTTNPELLKNKTPKQALDKWLREHALDYGLTLESGDPNKSGISEISKIANWKPEGGASPTTTSVKAEIKSSLRVRARTGLSRSTIYAYVQGHRFPRPVSISERCKMLKRTPIKARSSPKRRRYSLQRIKAGNCYDVSEICDLFNLHRNTVRHWLKSGLATIDNTRPLLVHGSALKFYLNAKQSSKSAKCALDELFCFRCKGPRKPWGGLVDFKITTDKIARAVRRRMLWNKAGLKLSEIL